MMRSAIPLALVLGAASAVLAACAAEPEADDAPHTEGLPESEAPMAADGARDVDADPRVTSAGAGTDGGLADGGGAVDGGDACPRLRITTPSSLNVRREAATSAPRLAVLFDGEVVERQGTVTGEAVGGSTVWHQVKLPAVAGYVHGSLATCTTEPATGPAGGYYLPFQCDATRRVTQGNATTFSHRNASLYAFDFSLGVGTPMLAMAPGTVKYVYDRTKPGDYCYDGRLDRAACIDKANLVNVQHGDGTVTQYAHLSRVNVKVGDKLKRGQVVGLSGSTGYSSGPHAHIVRTESCASPFCQSVPLTFVEVGVPRTGQDVTSKNCPR